MGGGQGCGVRAIRYRPTLAILSGAAGGSFLSSASAWLGKVKCVRARSLLPPPSFILCLLLAGCRTAGHQVQRLQVIARLSPCMAYSLSLVVMHLQIRIISVPMRRLGAASCVRAAHITVVP